MPAKSYESIDIKSFFTSEMEILYGLNEWLGEKFSVGTSKAFVRDTMQGLLIVGTALQMAEA